MSAVCAAPRPAITVVSTCQNNIGAIHLDRCYESPVTKQLSLALDRLTRRRKRRRPGRKQTRLVKSEPHRERPSLSRRHPVHVTVRTHAAVGTMRRHRAYRAIHRALRCAAGRDDFRVVHLSIQRTHVHFLVEADHALALARGMQGLQISAAKALNRSLARRGNVFTDRYHAVHITSPTQARHALRYVLTNWRHHGHGRDVRRIDPYSSAYVVLGMPPPLAALPLCRAETWLLRAATG
jgi:REP element-mobilizing transposase RayT